MNSRRVAISSITFVFSFANFLIFYSYPFMLGDLNISGGIAGIVVGFASCFTMIFRLASGIYMDKIGGRYVMTTVAAVYIASFALLNSHIYQLVILGRILIGISLGMLSTILMFHSIASAQSNAHKGQGIALYTFFSMLPTCLAPYLSLEILHYDGPGAIVVVAITLSFIGLALAFSIESSSAKVGGHGNNSPFSLRDVVTTVGSRDICIALGSLALLYTISGTTVSFLPAMLESTNQRYAAPYFLTFSIAMLVPRLLLKDHMPISDVFPVKAFLGAAACALCGGMLNYWLLSHPAVLVGAFLNGVALGYIYPAISAYVICQCADHIKGSMAAITSCFADGGVILANLTLGVSALYYPGKFILLFPIVFAAGAMALFVLAYYFSVTKKSTSSLIASSVQ
ncbi:MFS transporter [Undibacterium sp. RuRC25W]|uniref:MFS transporter n=1 Tax=Undibacterium sp. RuRC25W TaxID=3413047 RepID=UPI003BF3B8B7